jgi:deoxyribodipyrimidine photolyase
LTAFAKHAVELDDFTIFAHEDFSPFSRARDAGVREHFSLKTFPGVAPSLTKDLLINWQAGEAWFMANLVDGDPAANNGGWQWSAGTGTDAAPYFRIFNPILQGQKYDPDGVFIARWVPSLKKLPVKFRHEP